MDSVDEQGRFDAAMVRLARYMRIKIAMSWIVGLCVLALSVQIGYSHGLLWAAVAFVVGETLGAKVLGPLIMLPIGYAACGRDAMRLAQVAAAQRPLTP